MHTNITAQKVAATEYAEILQFYAEQMYYLDALEVEAYAATFTAKGIIEHRHVGRIQNGRQAIIDNALSILPAYRSTRSRHWNGGYLVQRFDTNEGPCYSVRYASLVTYQAEDGSGTTVKDPFVVRDTLLRDGNVFLVERRVITQE